MLYVSSCECYVSKTVSCRMYGLQKKKKTYIHHYSIQQATKKTVVEGLCFKKRNEFVDVFSTQNPCSVISLNPTKQNIAASTDGKQERLPLLAASHGRAHHETLPH